MEEYKSNSHKSREEQKETPISEKKVEKIIGGSVKTKKKNGIQKFTDAFAADDLDAIKTYILEDIVIPAIKDVVLDAVKAFLGVENRSNKRSTASKISYRSYYDKANDRDGYNSSRTKNGYNYDDIILDNRGEAEEVLSRMDELIATYGLVSVADLYDLVGISCNYTDNKYGWTNICSASVVRIRDGYLIKLPRALPLN